jgi:2-hydroxyacyl-CoA lyase 1
LDLALQKRRRRVPARFNWIFHFGQAPRYAKDMKAIQLDIAPEEIGHNKATEVALAGDGNAILGQLNKAREGPVRSG